MNYFQLSENDILLGCTSEDKYQVIRFVGEQMVKNGYVTPNYIDAMLAREEEGPTYLGETIAVPHGTIAAKEEIITIGVAFCQYPQWVLLGEHKDAVAKLVF